MIESKKFDNKNGNQELDSETRKCSSTVNEDCHFSFGSPLSTKFVQLQSMAISSPQGKDINAIVRSIQASNKVVAQKQKKDGIQNLSSGFNKVKPLQKNDVVLSNLSDKENGTGQVSRNESGQLKPNLESQDLIRPRGYSSTYGSLQKVGQAQFKETQSKSGLEDTLKTGLDHLSSKSMDDVKRDRYTSKPTQFQEHNKRDMSPFHHRRLGVWQRLGLQYPKQREPKQATSVVQSAPLTQCKVLSGEADSRANGAHGHSLIQKTVWESVGYTRAGMTNSDQKTNQTIANEWVKLDNKIPEAEASGSTAVTNQAQKTKMQVNYIKLQDAKTWGYVVEEQLNPLAESLGWATQKGLDGSRPDYYRKIGGYHVFADLTTPGESGPGGPHLGGKLAKGGAVNSDSCGADVTHNRGGHSGKAADPYTGMKGSEKKWLEECAEIRTMLKRAEASNGGLPYIDGIPEDYTSEIAGSSAREKTGSERAILRKIFQKIRGGLD